jgi:hypothetical protein
MRYDWPRFAVEGEASAWFGVPLGDATDEEAFDVQLGLRLEPRCHVGAEYTAKATAGNVAAGSPGAAIGAARTRRLLAAVSP